MSEDKNKPTVNDNGNAGSPQEPEKASRAVTPDEKNTASAYARHSRVRKAPDPEDMAGDVYDDEILDIIRRRKESKHTEVADESIESKEPGDVEETSASAGEEESAQLPEDIDTNKSLEPADTVELAEKTESNESVDVEETAASDGEKESAQLPEDIDANESLEPADTVEPVEKTESNESVDVEETAVSAGDEENTQFPEDIDTTEPEETAETAAPEDTEPMSELEKELAKDFAEKPSDSKTLKKYGFKPYTRELRAEEKKILQDAAMSSEAAAVSDGIIKKMAKGTGTKKKKSSSSGKPRTSQVDKSAGKAKNSGKSADKPQKSAQSSGAAKAPAAKKPASSGKDKKPAVKKKKRWVGFVRAFIRTIIVFALIGFLAGAGYTAYIISNAPTIQPKRIYDTLDVSTHIYDDKEKLVDEIYYSENRQIVTFEQLPENLTNAFIAVEDKTFWTHKGFNFKRIIGAILERFHGGRISGTSTITQQLARNVFLPEDKSVRSIKRKIIEMYYAYEIEQELSKEEIITAYLNTIYLGYGCYGVDTAAKTYFSSDVEDLTLEQCAALAALPQAPGSYALLVTEPTDTTVEYKNGIYINDLSKDRRDMILNMMLQQGLITEEQKESAIKPLADFIKPGSTDSATSQSAFKDYLIETVKKDLMNEYGIEEDQAIKIIYTKGLNIYTTMDSQAQKAITKQFKKKSNFPSAENGAEVESAMVVTEVGTGEVKAMVGTRNVTGEMLFNRATNPRQPGSSIKPLSVYAPALQKSLEYQEAGKKFKFEDTGYDKQGDDGWGDYITVSSKVTDEKMTVNGQTWPLNVTRSYSGYNTFRTAIQKSINTCAVKILAQIGIDYSMDTLKRFGITTAIDDSSQSTNDLNLAALGLGAMSYGISPLEMSLAYATFPNGGVRNTPICYTRVEDGSGRTLLEARSETVRVLDEGVAWIMTDVLKSVVTRGIAGDAKVSGIEVGGKTGTTNDRYDIWFNGFTPSYSIALWIGTDENVEMDSMSNRAAALWSTIVSKIDRAYEGSYPSRPDNVVRGWDGDYYTKGTVPPEPEPEPEEDEKDGKKGKGDGKKDSKKEGEKAPAASPAPAAEQKPEG